MALRVDASMSPRVPRGLARLPVSPMEGAPPTVMLKPLTIAAVSRLRERNWLTEASSTAFSRRSRLLEKG